MIDESNPDWTKDLNEDASAEALADLIELGARSADATPEEAAEVAGLASASREWQSELAARLARTACRSGDRGAGIRLLGARAESKRARRFYVWVGAGLAASLIVAVALIGWRRMANTPERLLAEAYTHSRIFDLRMPGSGFAGVTPQTHLRGSGTGRESALLLDARSIIERHLENAPEDPHWLQLEARADLMEEKFDPAIDILDRLLATGPVTSSLLADDGTAYFQRGAATGSENDRATALDYLRRADELAPGDTLVLFNEALVMEDRGQLMNAVETWNRYLQFEHDPHWLAEGRARLQALEVKLKKMKTHQSRMEQHLATPDAMRELTANSTALAAISEELSSTLLPRLLDAAYPMPVDRSRGSPVNCDDRCQSARSLLFALAASLQQNHHDLWLTQLLPSDSSSSNIDFVAAAHALAQAIGADVEGDYIAGRAHALQASRQFHLLRNPAGEDRAQLELAYAEQQGSNQAGCYQAVHSIVGRDAQFAWIQIYALTQDTLCDPAPGTASENNPQFLRAVTLARDAGYTLLELRARNLLGSPAVDTGDTEAAWRIYLPTVRRFYSGDYPPIRLYATLSGLAQVEEGTPRLRHALLLQREVVRVLELTAGRQLIPIERFNLATAAIRAGAIPEAEKQIALAQAELEAIGGGKSVQGRLAENEIAMADLYLDRSDLADSARMLDLASEHMAGEDNSYHRRDYAEARGRLELAQGHPERAEPLLQAALLDEERLAGKAGAESIVLAQQDRDLYAVLAGVWLAQGRSGSQILALWERYRLRILGLPAPACAGKELDCLEPEILAALKQFDRDRMVGQIALVDRLLLYRAGAQGVVFNSYPARRDDVMAAAAQLERAVSSPATPTDIFDRSARKVGELLLDPLMQSDGQQHMASGDGQLLLESDPLLGNLPWPAVQTAAGLVGLQTNLEELPSLALDRSREGRIASSTAAKPHWRALIVGASTASTGGTDRMLLPEVLREARAVARFEDDPVLLLGDEATEPQVAARLLTATSIHFAGHAAQQDGETRLLLASKAGPAKVPAASTKPASLVPDEPWLDSALLRKHPPRAASLAVFSACSTGKKEEEWNHGIGDIVATLASVGVPDVVATRWEIDSESAVPMMEGFYAGLAKGLTVPRSLTAARQALIRDPRYRHPHYWAAWYASGWGRSNLSRVFHGGQSDSGSLPGSAIPNGGSSEASSAIPPRGRSRE
jgi:CHAT domain-containing protein/tetratricopeptide (TPR) repeat protein